MNVVIQRPRELTREQLRSLRLELDKLGFTETILRRAWSDASNVDIAASIARFEDLLSYVQRGKSPKYTEKSELPVINQKCIRWWGIQEKHLKYIHPDQKKTLTEERFLQNGDILWNSTGTGTIGRACIFRGIRTADRVVADSHVTILRPNDIVEPDFLFRYISSPAVQERIEDMQTGSTNQVELSKNEIVATAIPLPPLPEQRRIVRKLDTLNAHSTSARAELATIKKLVERYKISLLQAAFKGKLTEDFRQKRASLSPLEVELTSSQLKKLKIKKYRLKNSEAPYDIPKSWRWLALPSLGELARGKSKHRPRNAKSLFGGPYPFIQTGDVSNCQGIIREYKSTYSEAGLAQSKLWPRGTLCITIAANIAETGILDFDGCFPDSIVGFVAEENKTSEQYIEFFIRTVRNDLEAFAPGVAQKNINLGTLSGLFIPAAPIEEQREIVKRLEVAFAKIDLLATEAEKALKLVDRLDQRILAKAFAGELVPQDPNDEHASVMLERIRAQRTTTSKPNRQVRKKKAA